MEVLARKKAEREVAALRQHIVEIEEIQGQNMEINSQNGSNSHHQVVMYFNNF
jgi:hypothetical protein